MPRRHVRRMFVQGRVREHHFLQTEYRSTPSLPAVASTDLAIRSVRGAQAKCFGSCLPGPRSTGVGWIGDRGGHLLNDVNPCGVAQSRNHSDEERNYSGMAPWRRLA